MVNELNVDGWWIYDEVDSLKISHEFPQKNQFNLIKKLKIHISMIYEVWAMKFT